MGWISDFQRLNEVLKRARYFLPSIPAIVQKRAGFTYFTKIDISMGFYTFELQKLCVISTPFGLYKYLRLPMVLTNKPDVFQSVMHPLFQDMPEIDVFIDDNCMVGNHVYIEKSSQVHIGINSFYFCMEFHVCHKKN